MSKMSLYSNFDSEKDYSNQNPNDKYWMPGVIPFHIVGTITRVPQGAGVVYAKVVNGNVYYLYPHTPGIDFSKLLVGQQVDLEITTELTRVFGATILED